ncbi:hypothetical protein [Actinomadura alba]|uniref:hypothetical protein n=1 Tax=Actinomadura alba TaxID=406431 RepID=UPI001FE4D8F5|nr:hypothetical protein [Actinomadura alba]
MANNVELAYTPTNSSWLNRIEAQFTALRYFSLDGADHASHKEQASMIRRNMVRGLRVPSRGPSPSRGGDLRKHPRFHPATSDKQRLQVASGCMSPNSYSSVEPDPSVYRPPAPPRRRLGREECPL